MWRRDILVLLGSAVLAYPASAAERRVWHLGWLDMSAPPSIDGSPDLQAFREGMKSLGYVEGADFVIEPRFANADRGSLQRLTKELLDARVDMIVTVGTPTTAEAKLATSSIPIVM